MHLEEKIFIAGHNGMVGSAIVRKFKKEGYHNLITRSSKELDLKDMEATAKFISQEKPTYVVIAAAKVGGIHANNTKRAEFIYENSAIALNLIHQSYIHHVKKLLFLGSTCIYPRLCNQPIKEEYLLTGALETTNEPYAIAKILGVKMCEAYQQQYGCNFISAMPTNLYGIGDNFNLQNAHVLPALMRKFHEAHINKSTSVTVWGSGNPLREFLYVDDLADACFFLMRFYDHQPLINIGFGEDISIKQLAQEMKELVNYKGEVIFDKTKPNGTPRKLTDSSKINQLGWHPQVPLKEGLRITYDWFKKNYTSKKLRKEM